MSFLLFVLFNLLYLWLFWTVYVLVMGLYRAYLKRKLKGLSLLMALPWVLIGLAMDVLANVFIATFVFVELPKEFLVTTRLQRYSKLPKNTFRYKLANYICTHLLDVFDPSEDHC